MNSAVQLNFFIALQVVVILHVFQKNTSGDWFSFAKILRMTIPLTIPDRELERIIRLADLDLDYSGLQDAFKDLTKLAAKVAGTDISLINLVDTFTQWTVSSYGIDLRQMPREDSVCHYTIETKDGFEVPDLSADERFKDKFYVAGKEQLRYYFGLPLQTSDGFNIGALCVLDKAGKEIPPENVEMLRIIADEIVNRFVALKVIQEMRKELREAGETNRRVAHDIRGPIGGIINLAQVIMSQDKDSKIEDVIEFIRLIQKSGSSLLEMADEILSSGKKTITQETVQNENGITLACLKEKIEKLYVPQALNKQIVFTINISSPAAKKTFPKNKLLQIIGNLVSNAIKFTPNHGTVTVDLGLTENMFNIKVADTGVGLNKTAIENILSGESASTAGTDSEKGYGFGLALVLHLVKSLGGTISIQSEKGSETVFQVALPRH